MIFFVGESPDSNLDTDTERQSSLTNCNYCVIYSLNLSADESGQTTVHCISDSVLWGEVPRSLDQIAYIHQTQIKLYYEV